MSSKLVHQKCSFLLGENFYRCKRSKKRIKDTSTKQANLILSKSNITVKTLPGYGNTSLKRKKIKPYLCKEKPLIKI